MIKVLIADDHPVVREGLREILTDQAETYIVWEAENFREVMRLIRNGQWDIVILDITMSGRNGFDALRQIKNEKPQTHVLIYTIHPEEHYGLRAIRNGANGYITKDCNPDMLISAIHRIIQGGKYITQSLAEKLANALDKEYERPPHDILTDREFQIFNLLSIGKTVSEIATELVLSVKTISTHRANILFKMNLRNNAELMHYYTRNCLDFPSKDTSRH